MRVLFCVGTILVTVWWAGSAAAQQAPPPAGSEGAAQSESEAPEPPQQTQDRAGRRDPFRTLITRQEGREQLPTCVGRGLGRLVIGQLQLQGIVRGIEDERIAMVTDSGARKGAPSYFLREKDELCNGTVTRITENQVVFEERFTDSFGRTRTRDVVKELAAD